MSFTVEGLMNSIVETILMVLVSTLIAYIIGLPLGILLSITSKKGLKPNKYVNTILGILVNILRSIPCLLAIVILIPLSNIFLGKGNWQGHWYSMIIPLVFVSFGFIARMVETSLNEVENGKIEAAKSLGATTFQIIYKVMLSEARSSLLSGFAVSIVSIIGYTSFAGYIAGGGLIYYAFNLGFYGTNETAMWLCVIAIVIIVQIIQEVTLLISRRIDRKRR